MRTKIRSVIKLLSIYVMRFGMRLLYVFPIKNNRIIINSYRGQQYACNPRYISEELLKLYLGKFEIIWAFNEPEQFSFLKSKGVKLVKYTSLKRFYYEATAKISINNIGSFSWLPLRKGQEHVNTWHGAVDYNEIALLDPLNDSIMKKTIKMSGDETSLFLSASRFMSEFCIPKEFGYYGKIMEYGYPRNDMTIIGGNDGIVANVRKKYHINSDDFVILYAPTWRNGISQEIPSLDFEQLILEIEKKFGKRCVILCRAHHITGNVRMNETQNLINATDYKNIQELYQVASMLITDYSSCLWDFALTNRPCLLFVPDLEEYAKIKGFNYPIKKWGYTVCKSNDDMCMVIKEMDLEKAKEQDLRHREVFGSYETGHSTEYFCKWAAKKCGIE